MNPMPTEPKNEALLPCPFCQNQEPYSAFICGGTAIVVSCRDIDCPAFGLRVSPKLWNRRTPPPAVGDGEDKAILDWFIRHIEHASGRDVSLNRWLGGETQIYVKGVCFEGPDLRAAILSAIRATGGPGK